MVKRDTEGKKGEGIFSAKIEEDRRNQRGEGEKREQEKEKSIHVGMNRKESYVCIIGDLVFQAHTSTFVCSVYKLASFPGSRA